MGVCPPNDIVAEAKEDDWETRKETGAAAGKKRRKKKKQKEKETKSAVAMQGSRCKMFECEDMLLLRRYLVFSSEFVFFSRVCSSFSGGVVISAGCKGGEGSGRPLVLCLAQASEDFEKLPFENSQNCHPT